nr:NlpC/P60 family protein [Streptomyces xiaopingdaonensis]
MLSAAAGATAVLAQTPAGAEPADEASRASVSSRVDGLYAQAEKATERYNAVAERAGSLREQVEHAQDRVARGQAKVNRMRGGLAAVAGAQYRSGGVDPALMLMLSSDPDTYLDRAAVLDRIGSRQATGLGQLQRAQRALDQQRTEATGKLDRLRSEQRELKKRKAGVQHKLAEARRLLEKLTPKERAERERGSRAGDRAQAGEAGGGKASSAHAASAVSAVKSALGSPYSWGATGPNSFDCSGLMQWAYSQAGVSIPRTSQAQRSAGRQVPLSQAKPGDLVLYRSDASHVGMYVGNDQVIHAPHPGAPVRFDPVGMMPVSSVTRP